MLGLGIVLSCLLIVAILGPLLAPYPGDAAASHLAPPPEAAQRGLPFGTDNLGRDIFSRVILGARGALAIALTVVAIAMLIGVPLGLIAGFRSGWLSETIMRVTDVVLAIPQLVLALALAQLMSPSLESAMLALSLTYWPFFTRIVYAETRRLAVVAVRRRPARRRRRRRRIVFLHILPNCPLAGDRARHHRAGLHHPGRRRPGLSRHGRDAAGARLGPHHRRKPHLPAARLVVSRPSRASPS